MASRGLSAGMVTEATADQYKPTILLKAEFDSGDLLLWSGVGEITYNSDIYIGAGDLLAISDITEGIGVTAKGASFNLSGLNPDIISATLSENPRGRAISVWFAMMDSSDAIISDPILLFKGDMDVPHIKWGGSSATVSIQAENRLIDLKRAKVRRYTPEDQKQQYSADLGLDFVASLQDKEITWGKT